jgi:hypothetical protein
MMNRIQIQMMNAKKITIVQKTSRNGYDVEASRCMCGVNPFCV